MTIGMDPNDHNRTESHVQPLSDPEPSTKPPSALEHWCATHEMAYTRKNGKGGDSWWSHKAPDRSWCRE